MGVYLPLLGEGVSEVSFNIENALTTAGTIITWVVNQVAGNAVLAAAFTMGLLIPAGVKAFKRIAKVGK